MFSNTADPLLGFDDFVASYWCALLAHAHSARFKYLGVIRSFSLLVCHSKLIWPGGGNPHPVCYAQRYKDIREHFCFVSWPFGGYDCDWDSIVQQWRTRGQYEGRIWGCQAVDYCTQVNKNIMNLIGTEVPFNLW